MSVPLYLRKRERMLPYENGYRYVACATRIMIGCVAVSATYRSQTYGSRPATSGQASGIRRASSAHKAANSKLDMLDNNLRLHQTADHNGHSSARSGAA